MGWAPNSALTLTIRDGVVLLSIRTGRDVGLSGLGAALDNRWRVRLPYGIRVSSALSSGTRLMVVTAPVEGVVAALPVSRVVSALIQSS